MQITANHRRTAAVLAVTALIGSVVLTACDSSTTAGKDIGGSSVPTTAAVAPRPSTSGTPAPSPGGSASSSAKARTSTTVSVPSPTNTGTLRSHLQGEKIAYAQDANKHSAATYDQTGHIAFWIFTQGGWIKQGSSTYPTPIARDMPVTVHGYQLSDKAHVTDGSSVDVYVVDGEFTTDGAANSAVFASGSNGWGALAAERSLLMSTGSGVSPTTSGALFYGAKVAPKTDSIATSECPSNKPIYQCGGANLTVTPWYWSNVDTAFSRQH